MLTLSTLYGGDIMSNINNVGAMDIDEILDGITTKLANNLIDLHSRIKLKQIRLINCQSHKDTLIELSNGLNVIVAENSTGKSVLFKVLKVVCVPDFYTRRARAKIVRHGAEEAEAQFLFTDGSFARVRITKGSVIYQTKQADDDSFESHVEPPAWLIFNLSLLVDAKEKFIANLLDMSQNLLLVNSSSKANSNLMKILTSDEQLDRIIVLTGEKEQEFKKTLAVAEQKLVQVKTLKSIHKYVNIHELDEQISIFSSLLSVTEDLTEGYIILDDMVEVNDINFDELINNLDTLILLAEQDYHIHLIKEDDDFADLSVLDDIIDLGNAYQEFTHYQFVREQGTAHLDDLHELGDLLLELQVIEEDGVDLSFLEQTTILAEGFFTMTIMRDNLIKIDTVERLNMELDEFINSQGVNVKCPLYGEVQHVAGNCIPKDYGFAPTRS